MRSGEFLLLCEAKMRLITNWQHILKHAGSIRLILLAGVLSGVEVILPMFSDSIPRGVFAVLSLVVSGGGVVARLVAQPVMQQGASDGTGK